MYSIGHVPMTRSRPGEALPEQSVTGTILLHAPFRGWVCELAKVPDEVFAGGMMGEGLAIDPLGGELLAPCDGCIELVAPTAHAVTLRAANGAQILLHIGLETVGLGGRGFTPRVVAGQQVKQGDVLISFDLDAIALEATSLITPMIVTNADHFAFVASADGLVAAGAPIATVAPNGRALAAPPESRSSHATGHARVMLANGLHARPAARIAACAKRFSSKVHLRSKGREAAARSPVSVMALDVRAGERIEIDAVGEDASAAVDALSRLIEIELEALEIGGHAVPARPARGAAEPNRTGHFNGVCAVPGLAIGPAFHLSAGRQDIVREGAGKEQERGALDDALARLRRDLAAAAGDRDPIRAGIAEAHLALSEDQAILDAVGEGIERGESAAYAWRGAIAGVTDSLRTTGNALLEERVLDLLDLERRVLDLLRGDDAPAPADPPPGAIVIAEEILPSQVMQLTGRVAGLCTVGGGPTSHVAVLAAAAGLPTLVAAGPAIAGIAEGTMLLLDAAAGRLQIADDAATVAAARARIDATLVRAQTDRESAIGPCRTADGTRIELFANIGSADDAAAAVAAGAEGCGLLRTEFLFLERAVAPGEEEQLAAYQAIADALGIRPLIVRTLDIGGDKPLPYLPLPAEDNPALGLRGIRIGLLRPEILDEQLRAILRVQPIGRCRIMVPMISSVAELRAVRARAHAVASELHHAAPFELGVMIETPAAALLADRLAADADFFSVGTNDLTQYTLAMDRTNPLVAAQVDAFHPAVLSLIASAASAAAGSGRSIGACGGLASDPFGAVLLVGLGIDELSVAPAAIAAVKSRLRGITIDQCRALADRALAQDSAGAVRALAAEAPDTPTAQAGDST